MKGRLRPPGFHERLGSLVLTENTFNIHDKEHPPRSSQRRQQSSIVADALQFVVPARLFVCLFICSSVGRNSLQSLCLQLIFHSIQCEDLEKDQ